MSSPSDFKPDQSTESLINQIQGLGIQTSVIAAKSYDNLLAVLESDRDQPLINKAQRLSKIRDEILAYRLTTRLNRGVLDIEKIINHKDRKHIVEFLEITQKNSHKYRAFLSVLCDALLLEESTGSDKCFARVRDIILGGF